MLLIGTAGVFMSGLFQGSRRCPPGAWWNPLRVMASTMGRNEEDSEEESLESMVNFADAPE